MDAKPVYGIAAIDWRRHPARDVDHLIKLLQAVGLIRPDEAEQGDTAFVERRIDGVQIASAALDNTNAFGDVQE